MLESAWFVSVCSNATCEDTTWYVEVALTLTRALTSSSAEKEMLFVCSSVEGGTPIPENLQSVYSLLFDTPAADLIETLTCKQIPNPDDVARAVRRLKSMFILLLV